MTDHVLIFDTTLRDGEQSPGATMTHAEKLEIAELLDDMEAPAEPVAAKAAAIAARFPIYPDQD